MLFNIGQQSDEKNDVLSFLFRQNRTVVEPIDLLPHHHRLNGKIALFERLMQYDARRIFTTLPCPSKAVRSSCSDADRQTLPLNSDQFS